MTDYKELANLLFPNIDKTPDYYEELYPLRKLKEGARVTRFAPSPTGYLHFGNLYTCMAAYVTAKATDGVFYVRVEDTDQKRKVDGAVSAMLKGLSVYGIVADEGVIGENEEKGDYAPYYQSARKDIYQAYAKSLVMQGLAYPCFCSAEELDEIRASQENEDIKGYYGKYAKCRNLSLDEIKKKIESGAEWTLRLKSPGDAEKKCYFDDMIKGKIEMPENIQDIVLLKSDGIPTYHFAHAIDDHLMRTTHVVRGDEWIASVPVHLQLFKVLGFKPVKYAHVAPIMKEENGGKRKLSKRKDPELSLDYYRKDGYHPYCMKVYLLTLLNSNFEEWHEKFPDKDINEFPFSIDKMNQSGALFDKDKLHNICKNELSKLSEDEVYDFLYNWAEEYEKDKASVWFADKEKMLSILRLYMGVGMKRRRKDLMYAKQIFELISYFFDIEGTETEKDEFRISKDEADKLLGCYLESYSHDDDNSVWFDKLKAIADNNGYASDMKAYKANPENYKGNVSDVAEVVRIAVTGRANTPDLWTIVHIMGEDQMRQRIENVIGK